MVTEGVRWERVGKIREGDSDGCQTDPLPPPPPPQPHRVSEPQQEPRSSCRLSPLSVDPGSPQPATQETLLL